MDKTPWFTYERLSDTDRRDLPQFLIYQYCTLSRPLATFGAGTEISEIMLDLVNGRIGLFNINEDTDEREMLGLFPFDLAITGPALTKADCNSQYLKLIGWK